jgi:hypothetical protein
MNAITLKSGDLAYFDSFAGLIPCKVVSISGTSGRAGSDQTATVRLTAGRGAFKQGELHTGWALHYVPRKAVRGLRSRNCSARIGPYSVQCDEVTQ